MAIRPYKGILPTLGARAYVDESATVIGDVALGADSSVTRLRPPVGTGSSWLFKTPRGDRAT